MRRVVLLLPALLSLSFTSPVVAQQVPPEDMSLRTFLLAAYPELQGLPWQITVLQGEPTARDIEVTEVEAAFPRGGAQRLLRAHVEFSSHHDLRTFVATAGRVLRESDNAALAKDLSEARAQGRDVQAELRRHLLRLGPMQNEDVLAALRGLDLESCLGAHRVLSVAPRLESDGARFPFLWSAEVQAQRDGEGPRHYRIDIEPFEGRVLAVRER